MVARGILMYFTYQTRYIKKIQYLQHHLCWVVTMSLSRIAFRWAFYASFFFLSFSSVFSSFPLRPFTI